MQVAIITEGFQGTGYGHLTRCLALYQAFEENDIEPIFIANCDERGKIFIETANLIQLDWLDDTVKLYEYIDDYDIVIIDSYLANVEIYENIYKVVNKAVYIDDYNRINYPPGIVVNGTIGAESSDYDLNSGHIYLLGVKYVAIRKSFWNTKIPQRYDKKIQDVLIIFGGQDEDNFTSKILIAMERKFPEFKYHVVLGNQSTRSIDSDNVCYYSSLNSYQMLELMLKSDFAITAAGQTIYELLAAGLPFIGFKIADNQQPHYKYLVNFTFHPKIKTIYKKDEFPQFIDDISATNLNHLHVYSNNFLTYLKGQKLKIYPPSLVKRILEIEQEND